MISGSCRWQTSQSAFRAARKETAHSRNAFGEDFPTGHCRTPAQSGNLFPAHRLSVYTGAGRVLLGGVETAERILGATGIRSRGQRLPEAPDVVRNGAFDALAAWFGAQNSTQILALGPLTNLASLALSRPDLLPRVGRITWMGGGITLGNHTASAEFNAIADPEALAVLLARGVPVRMIDLEACRRAQITEADIRGLHGRIRAGAGRRMELLADLLGGYLDIGLERGRSGMALFDPVAAAALLSSDLFTFEEARIEIELCGNHTRGRTVVGSVPGMNANGEIAVEVEAGAVKHRCLQTLVAAA